MNKNPSAGSRAILARNILLLSALDEISRKASDRGLQFLPLKGAALLTAGVCAPEEREMTDLDILVRQSDEKAFEAVLSALGFKLMTNSSQAYCRSSAGSAPPVIADLHTGLWHVKKIEALWQRSVRGNAEHPCVLVPGFEDQLLHIASHTLLYHGCLTDKTLEDLARLLEFIYAKKERAGFWLRTGEIAAAEGLRPVVYPALRRLSLAYPHLLTKEELLGLEPKGSEKLKSRFFEKAASGHSRLLEYFIPCLHRPDLFFSLLFPDRRFLEKRYGKASSANRLKRPFQLLTAILRKEP